MIMFRGILQSHLIDPDQIFKDNFDEFFKKREEALLNKIERAMGKPISYDSSALEVQMDVQDYQTDEENEI